MSQNFTIDDSGPTLAWGSGWGVQSPSDSALDNYFDSTYHGSRTIGANVSLSFSGVAISLFGSKGPDHGNFSVRYDNLVQLLSAQADTPSYRELLFSATFPPGNHSITLTNTDNNQSWLDLDFVTVTPSESVSVPIGFSSTIMPPSAVAPTTTTQGSSASLASATIGASSQSSSLSSGNSSDSTTLILAIAFGGLLFFLVSSVVWYFIRRAHRRGSTPSQPLNGAAEPATHELYYSSGSAFQGPQSIMRPIQSHPSSLNPSPLGSSRTAYNNNGVPADNSSNTQPQQLQANITPVPPVPPVRPWSPFSLSIGRIFAAAKEDGSDSMKSTFLKV